MIHTHLSPLSGQLQLHSRRNRIRVSPTSSLLYVSHHQLSYVRVLNSTFVPPLYHHHRLLRLEVVDQSSLYQAHEENQTIR
jgi:hypothetical protein